MQAVSLSEVRKGLKKHLDMVYHDHEPLIITRKNDENVVVLSLQDYNALVETRHLLSSPSNAARLRSSLGKARAGKVTQRKLIEA